MVDRAQLLRILLVDDHELFRSGIRTELADHPGMQVIGEARDGVEAIAMARETAPDVVLMDITMPKCSGLAAMEQIKRDLPHVRVIMLTVHDDDENVVEAIKRGADGYLMKDLRASELLDTLDKVAQGETIIDGQVASRLLRELREPERADRVILLPDDELTSRELEVLERLVAGDTYAEIGCALVISENTVKMHVSNITAKLHVRNRIQAVVHAIREGLVDISP